MKETTDDENNIFIVNLNNGKFACFFLSLSQNQFAKNGLKNTFQITYEYLFVSSLQVLWNFMTIILNFS